MDNNIIFIEKGSVTNREYSKLSDYAKSINASIIEFEAGSTKPEVVSVKCSDSNIEEIKKQIEFETMTKLIDRLLNYLSINGRIVERYDNERREHICYTTFSGTPEDIIKDINLNCLG